MHKYNELGKNISTINVYISFPIYPWRVFFKEMVWRDFIKPSPYSKLHAMHWSSRNCRDSICNMYSRRRQVLLWLENRRGAVCGGPEPCAESARQVLSGGSAMTCPVCSVSIFTCLDIGLMQENADN